MPESIDCHGSDEGSSKKETKKRHLCIRGMTVAEKHRRIREKAFCFEDVGGLMYKYVRGSVRSDDEPSELKRHADLAIRFYNETVTIGYGVVNIVRATKFLVDGSYFRITFTAKLPHQEDEDALTFRAKITFGITYTNLSVRLVDRPTATSPMIDAPAI